MLRVQYEFMFRQLGLSILASAAEFTIHRGFHDDPGSALVRGHRNLEVHIAIGGIDTRPLVERRMVAITADLKTKDLALGMGHRAARLS